MELKRISEQGTPHKHSLKTHRANDQAVLAAYGWQKDITESGDCDTAHADVSGDGKIATGKTETAEHAPLSHSKAGHSEAQKPHRHMEVVFLSMYGFSKKTSEAEIVAALFKLYKKLVEVK